jgi:3-hydroxyisobutyrate dehydrogenase
VETVGLIGLGKIGLPIAENLIKSGYRVLGYRRSAMDAFQAAGGVPAASPSAIGEEADIVLTCLPSAEALDEVVQGPRGLKRSARPGQIVAEIGSHLIPDKERQIAPLAEKGAIFLDAEISGTPGMVAARRAVIYLSGDAGAARKIESVMRGITETCLYFGPFGAASKVKLINNHLVSIHIAATAEAMALGLKAGVDPDLMIKAVAGGSGGSTQFGIRAPWMAQRRFLPAQGDAVGLAHYFELIGDFADRAGVATPLLDRAIELYERCIDMGVGRQDLAVMVDVIGSIPRRNAATARPKKKATARKAIKRAKARGARNKSVRKPKTRRRTK